MAAYTFFQYFEHIYLLRKYWYWNAKTQVLKKIAFEHKDTTYIAETAYKWPFENSDEVESLGMQRESNALKAKATCCKRNCRRAICKERTRTLCTSCWEDKLEESE